MAKIQRRWVVGNMYKIVGVRRRWFKLLARIKVSKGEALIFSTTATGEQDAQEKGEDETVTELSGHGCPLPSSPPGSGRMPTAWQQLREMTSSP